MTLATLACVALTSPAPGTEPCVLLRNGNAVLGTATRLGEIVLISKDDSNTIQVPRREVVATAETLSQLYQIRSRDRVKGDLRRLHSDIRWCLRYGLLQEAGRDVLEAQRIAPKDSVTQQLLGRVAHAFRSQQQAQQESVQQVSHQSPADESHQELSPRSGSDAQLDATTNLEPESVRYFSTRIQPILLNRCSGCHWQSQDCDREFQMHPSIANHWAPSRTGRENLQAVLSYVDMNDPLRSPIRAWATDGHGGKTKSLTGTSGKNAPATRSLARESIDQGIERTSGGNEFEGRTTPCQRNVTAGRATSIDRVGR